MLIFFWAYFAILRHPLAAATVMPLTLIDDWVAFQPSALPAYASLWVYVSLPPALLTSLPTLLRFGGWMAALCITCLVIFWVWPTSVPPAQIDWTLYPQMALIKGVDPGGNACPSLHVASAVFAALWLDRLCQATGAPTPIRIASALHCLLILWSTMATRQHVFYDVLAGGFIGAAFGLIALYHAARVARPGELRAVEQPSSDR